MATMNLQRAQLAKLTGCNLETIRYFEKVGLMPDPPRSAKGYRLYSPDLVQRLRFILRARELGFSTDEVASLQGLMDTGTQTCAEIKHRTELHLADVRTRISDLMRIEVLLSQTAAQCTGGMTPDCPILDVLTPAAHR